MQSTRSLRATSMALWRASSEPSMTLSEQSKDARVHTVRHWPALVSCHRLFAGYARVA